MVCVWRLRGPETATLRAVCLLPVCGGLRVESSSTTVFHSGSAVLELWEGCSTCQVHRGMLVVICAAVISVQPKLRVVLFRWLSCQQSVEDYLKHFFRCHFRVCCVVLCFICMTCQRSVPCDRLCNVAGDSAGTVCM